MITIKTGAKQDESQWSWNYSIYSSKKEMHVKHHEKEIQVQDSNVDTSDDPGLLKIPKELSEEIKELVYVD